MKTNTIMSNVRSFIIHAKKVFGKITHRHCVGFVATGIFTIDDYTERYDWLSENVKNYNNVVWIDAEISTTIDFKSRQATKGLTGQLRFKYRTDALAYMLRWA